MTRATSALSLFTPSVMPHELLERLFVARERMLDAILARVDAATSSAERNHTLLVGPRGAGKTHLVALAYHRINERRKGGARLQVAWLPEDAWTIVSYRHFLAAIVERLEPALDGDVPRLAPELEGLLAAKAALGGPIVVLVENLDRILHALENEGQQRLRHLLQADRSLLLIATSTRLDRTLADQASPFYGFFTTSRLEPFDVDEAASMLAAIARERDDSALVDYLHTDEGRARLCTIAHLAGGQPRMWATLASALTVDGLDDLVDLLLTRFDDLTPYYQERLGRLSGQQRLVVAELAEQDRPINVRELGERLGIEQRSLAKTISDLVELGWASATTSPVTAMMLDKRRTYYELAEPLARLSFQIKESRGEPLRLVVEFVKHWFDPSDLGSAKAGGLAAEYVLLAGDGQDQDAVIAVTRRLQRLPITRAPAVELLGEIDDALAALERNDPEAFIRLPTPVRVALETHLGNRGIGDVRREIHYAAGSEFGHTPHPAMAAWIGRAEEMVTNDAPDRGLAQVLLVDWLGRAWRFDDAREVLTAAASVLGAEHSDALDARANLACAYSDAGRTTDAINLEEAVLSDSERLLGPEHPDTLMARANLAVSYGQAGRTTEAITLGEAVLTDSERLRGPEHPDTLMARANLAVSYRHVGRITDAITLQEGVLAVSERVLGPEHPDTLNTRNNLALSFYQAGRTTDAIALLEAILTESKRVLGAEHPDTLTAGANLAVTYRQAGRTIGAITLQEGVLSDRERVLGPEHPDTLMARDNLAVSYRQAGRTTEAIALLEAVLRDRERLLGPEHPHTLTTRNNLANSYQQTGGPSMPNGCEPRRA